MSMRVQQGMKHLVAHEVAGELRVTCHYDPTRTLVPARADHRSVTERNDGGAGYSVPGYSGHAPEAPGALLGQGPPVLIDRWRREALGSRREGCRRCFTGAQQRERKNETSNGRSP